MPHRLLIALALALVPFGRALGQPAEAGPSAISAVNETMFFRVTGLGDSMSYDACSVFTAAGQPSAFPEGISPGLLHLLDRQGSDPCSQSAEPGPRARRRVVVRAVEMGAEGACVTLLVLRGEWVHREFYTMVPREDGRWSLREIRMDPPMHFLPPPPDSSGTVRSGEIR